MMANWVFWYVYGTIAYILISTVFIWINWFAIKVHYELWRGRKTIVLWKRGQVIIDWRIQLNEPKLGIKRDEETYKIDEQKGLQFKRLPVHIFDVDNIAELDFADKKNVYPPHKFDPVVFTKVLLRALASGVNDLEWKKYAIIGGVFLLVIGVCALASAYFGYNIYSHLLDQGVIKL